MNYFPICGCLNYKRFLNCDIHGGDLYRRCPECRTDLFSPDYGGLKCEVEKWQLKEIEKSESRRPLFLMSARFVSIGEVGVDWLKCREASGVVFHHLPVLGSESQSATLEVLGSYEREVVDAEGVHVCQCCKSFIPPGNKLKFGKISNCNGSDFVVNRRYSGMAYVKSDVFDDLVAAFPGVFELQILGARHAIDDGLETSGGDLMGGK